MRRLVVAAFMLFVVLAFRSEAGTYRKAGKPLANRYIVVLNDDVPAGEVHGLAKSLGRQYDGSVLGVMTNAMKGFGMLMTEQRARALMHHPAVRMVEEDEQVELSDAPVEPFNFAAARARVQPLANNCPWSGSYFTCTYSDDTFWALDRLDNQGLLYSLKAYAYNSTGSGVRAYVIDSGIYGQHVEFDSRVKAGANMTVDPDISNVIARPDEEFPITLDYSPANFPCNQWLPENDLRHWVVGHGTAAASVLGGTNTGVAKNVRIVPVKVITCERQRAKLSMARGLDWVLADMQGRSGRAVVSMSTFVDPAVTNGRGVREDAQVCEDGFGGYTNCLSAIEHVINNLIGANIPVVVSANNYNDGSVPYLSRPDGLRQRGQLSEHSQDDYCRRNDGRQPEWLVHRPAMDMCGYSRRMSISLGEYTNWLGNGVKLRTVCQHLGSGLESSCRRRQRFKQLSPAGRRE